MQSNLAALWRRPLLASVRRFASASSRASKRGLSERRSEASSFRRRPRGAEFAYGEIPCEVEAQRRQSKSFVQRDASRRECVFEKADRKTRPDCSRGVAAVQQQLEARSDSAASLLKLAREVVGGVFSNASAFFARLPLEAPSLSPPQLCLVFFALVRGTAASWPSLASQPASSKNALREVRDGVRVLVSLAAESLETWPLRDLSMFAVSLASLIQGGALKSGIFEASDAALFRETLEAAVREAARRPSEGDSRDWQKLFAVLASKGEASDARREALRVLVEGLEEKAGELDARSATGILFSVARAADFAEKDFPSSLLLDAPLVGLLTRSLKKGWASELSPSLEEAAQAVFAVSRLGLSAPSSQTDTDFSWLLPPLEKTLDNLAAVSSDLDCAKRGQLLGSLAASLSNRRMDRLLSWPSRRRVWQRLLPLLLRRSGKADDSYARGGKASASRLKALSLGCIAAARRAGLDAPERKSLLTEAAPTVFREVKEAILQTKADGQKGCGGALSAVTVKVLLDAFSLEMAQSRDAAVGSLQRALLECVCTLHATASCDILAFFLKSAGILAASSPNPDVRSAAQVALTKCCQSLRARLEDIQKNPGPFSEDALSLPAAAAVLATLSRLPALPVQLVELLHLQLLGAERETEKKEEKEKREKEKKARRGRAGERVEALSALLLATSRLPGQTRQVRWLGIERRLLAALQEKAEASPLSLLEVQVALRAHANAMRIPCEEMLALLRRHTAAALDASFKSGGAAFVEGNERSLEGPRLLSTLAKSLEDCVRLGLHLHGEDGQALVGLLCNGLSDALFEHAQRCETQRDWVSVHPKGVVASAAFCATHLLHPPLLREALRLCRFSSNDATKGELCSAEDLQLARFAASVALGFYDICSSDTSRETFQRGESECADGLKHGRGALFEWLLSKFCEGDYRLSAIVLGSASRSLEASRLCQTLRKQELLCEEKHNDWSSEETHAEERAFRLQREVYAALTELLSSLSTAQDKAPLRQEVQTCLFSIDILVPSSAAQMCR